VGILRTWQLRVVDGVVTKFWTCNMVIWGSNFSAGTGYTEIIWTFYLFLHTKAARPRSTS